MKSKIKSPRVRILALAGAAAVTCGIAIPQVSSAATSNTSTTQSAAAVTQSYPTFAHLPADQAAHPNVQNEWWYTVGHLYSGGHEYGYEVNLTAQGMAQLAITDVTAGKYYTQTARFKPGQYSASSKQLDVKFPNAALSGPKNHMHLTAKLPQGNLDLMLDAKGPVLYNNGTGLFPFLNGTSYYYSLPNVKTTGSLTLNGKTSKVTGKSWLDRQWGNWDWTQVNHWTWMAVQLKDGQYLNLWDLYTKQGEQRWATVLHPDGSESVVSIKPLAKHATDFATSPTTGQRYAGKWTVEIPSLNTKLTVKSTPTLQEIHGGVGAGGVNESSATVTGTYQGKPVTGRAYVEQLGNWR